MTPKPPFLRLDRVTKAYRPGTPAIDDVTLDVAKGEFLTLLGPSGSGKTTLLMMLAGFEHPDSGQILLEGEPLAAVPPHRRDFGVVFQSYALFPHMTVAQNVAFPLGGRGLARRRRRELVDQGLEMVHLTALARRRPAELSGGEQQRVALARAIAFEPRLVLLDEPLGALDRDLRETMQAEIATLHRTLKVTIIHVTHDQREALALSDRIVVLRAGQIEQVGSPVDLYERPESPFVARFVGESNELRGTVIENDGGLLLVRLGDNFADGATVEAEAAQAVATGRLAVGTQCRLAVRPERIAIVAGDPSELGPGALAGRVAGTVYLGESVRVRVALGRDGGGPEVIVVRPAGAGVAGLHGGRPVALAWSGHEARAFPAAS